MRLTTDEILEKYPSMNMSGKHYDTVQGRYYGDLPYGNGKPLKWEPPTGNSTIDNIEAVDRFVSAKYCEDEVYKYAFCHGDGYLRKHGDDYFAIGGSLTLQYNGGAYHMTLFNDHCGINGFNIWKGDSGKVTIVAYASSDQMWNMLPTKNVRDTIDVDIVKKIFNKTKKNDEYGFFAQKIIERAESMLE